MTGSFCFEQGTHKPLVMGSPAKTAGAGNPHPCHTDEKASQRDWLILLK